MGEQRPAIIADEVADNLLDRPPAETAVHLQSADDLTAEHPDVVAVQAQGLARQRQGAVAELSSIGVLRLRKKCLLSQSVLRG